MIYYRYINIKKGTEQTHLYFSWYIPHIWITFPYAFDIHGIYHVYTMYIHVYTLCIHADIAWTISFSGFRGSHRPNTPPSHGTSDNVPDQHDEADFDIPDTQSVLETLEYSDTQSNSADMPHIWQEGTQHPHLPDCWVRARPVSRGYASQLLPIRYGAPSISGKKCQGIYIYMVYVVCITCICL